MFFGVNLVTFLVSFLSFYALYLAISLSLNLEFGMAGVPNFGKVLFIAGGAAFAGSISGRLAAFVLGVNTHGDFIDFSSGIILQVNAILAKDPTFAIELVVVSLAVAAAIGALLGYLASYPALRLREDYLGMLLLGSAQFFQIIMRTYVPLTGGVESLAVPNPYAYWDSVGTGYRDLVAALVMSAFAVLVYIYAERVARSPLSRTLRAVRENEDAARALGKNDASLRRKVLIISSAIAAMAGALFTIQVGTVGYDTWTRFAWTFWPFLIVIIGGAGNNVGVAVGAFFFALLFKGLNQIQPYLQPYIFFDANWLQDLLFAGLLIAILMVRPDGLIREKSAPTLPRGKLASMAAQFHLGQEAGPTSSRRRRMVARLKKLARRGGSSSPGE